MSIVTHNYCNYLGLKF